uniref:Uncharacterized protein n=1 Tax=Cricetulus griseus TaxID=10029 RepID=A0A8C2LXF2_CRIGR
MSASPDWVSFIDGFLCVVSAKACITYFETYSTMLSGNKKIMNDLISKFNPTDKERAAHEKIQDCYNEAGVEGKTLDTLVLHEITDSPECKEYYTKDTMQIMKSLFSM